MVDDDSDFVPESYLMREEDRTQLIDMINTLSDDHRMVLTLFYYRRLSINKIAEILNANKTTIEKRLSRARQALKQKLEHNMEGAAMGVVSLASIFEMDAGVVFTLEMSAIGWQAICAKLGWSIEVVAATMQTATGSATATASLGTSTAGTSATAATAASAASAGIVQSITAAVTAISVASPAAKIAVAAAMVASVGIGGYYIYENHTAPANEMRRQSDVVELIETYVPYEMVMPEAETPVYNIPPGNHNDEEISSLDSVTDTDMEESKIASDTPAISTAVGTTTPTQPLHSETYHEYLNDFIYHLESTTVDIERDMSTLTDDDIYETENSSISIVDTEETPTLSADLEAIEYELSTDITEGEYPTDGNEYTQVASQSTTPSPPTEYDEKPSPETQTPSLPPEDEIIPPYIPESPTKDDNEPHPPSDPPTEISPLPPSSPPRIEIESSQVLNIPQGTVPTQSQILDMLQLTINTADGQLPQIRLDFFDTINFSTPGRHAFFVVAIDSQGRETRIPVVVVID